MVTYIDGAVLYFMAPSVSLPPSLLSSTCSCPVRLLNTAQGSLLDDEVLVNTLQSSKTTSEEVTEQLETSVQTEAKIDAAREVCVFVCVCDE